jgi:Na+/melibiose symporter-like transporter
LATEGEKKEERVEKVKKLGILDWFKMPSFYLFCICYVGVRIFYNVFGALTPFYLVDVLKMGENSSVGLSFNLALVPLLVYASAMISSSRISMLYRVIGRKKTLLTGTTVGALSLLALYYLTPDYSWVVYYLAVFIGTSSGLIVSTGINLIS